MSAGKNLIAAKAEVNHKEWLPMLEDIGISRSWAAKLMEIARNPAISNVAPGLHLPTSIKALYELSRLPAEDIENGIANGDITPDN